MVCPCSGPRIKSGLRKSFHTQSPRKIPTVAVAGRSSGMTIVHHTRSSLAPPPAPVLSSRIDDIPWHGSEEPDIHKHRERHVPATDIGEDQPRVTVCETDALQQ